MSTKNTDSVRCLDESYVSTKSSISSPFAFKAVVLRLGPGQGKIELFKLSKSTFLRRYVLGRDHSHFELNLWRLITVKNHITLCMCHMH